MRAPSTTNRVLVLIELKGGNDGLNTVVPYADPNYSLLRESLALKREEVIALSEKVGLHPELKALMPLWEAHELGIIQNVGYPQPNLSHFRSIEIWETASRANEFLQEGWVTRALQDKQVGSIAQTADGVLIGSSSQGCLLGSRAVSLTNPEAFLNQARLAHAGNSSQLPSTNLALRHILEVQDSVNHAAKGLQAEKFPFNTVFPSGGFGNSVRAASQVIASQRGRGGIPVITLTLGSFDTHQNQLVRHANLLTQLAEGIAALKGATRELGVWDQTLIMTFSEFGRRPRQNSSNGTDHGTSAPHFVAGGAVRGGWYGSAPDLERLDPTQNLVFSTDFRQLYATVVQDWWGTNPEKVVRGQFETLRFIRA